MRQIVIDGKNWAAPDDFYDSLFQAVGAPAWHGRNFNAVRDSIYTGGINKIEIPYLIKILNYGSIGARVRKITDDFIALIKEMQKSGCPVEIEVEH